MMRSAPYLLSILLLQAASVVPAAVVAAQDSDIEYAESLVRTVYYEGMPYAAASQVSEAGAARLVEMLGDPAEASQHAQILTALGICGHPGSFEALHAFLERLRSGEIDRDEFRAWRALPMAMGYLARKDPRALAWLIAQLREDAEDGRSFGTHDLLELRRRAAARGLGTSGQPEAHRVLSEFANFASARGSDDERFGLAIQEALAVHASVAVQTPAGVSAEANKQ